MPLLMITSLESEEQLQHKSKSSAKSLKRELDKCPGVRPDTIITKVSRESDSDKTSSL